MKRRFPYAQAGFSIVETLMGAAAAMVVGVGIFAILNTGTMLSARNLSVNVTNNALRGSLDKAEQLLQQADSMPILIDTSGNNAAGPAAGVRFDLFIGAPYVITTTASGLASSTGSLAMVRSTNAMASPPIPKAGDLILIDGESALLRPRVASVVTGSVDATTLRQTLTCTLSSALGTAVSGSSTTLTCKLVRNVALIVMPNGSRRELRYYHSFDTTTNLNDMSKYTVLTDQVAMQSDDSTPFSLITAETKSFVNMSFRVRANKFDQRFVGKQADQFNTFSRVDVQIRPKVNP